MIECIQVAADVVLKIIYQTETIKNFLFWLESYIPHLEHCTHSGKPSGLDDENQSRFYVVCKKTMNAFSRIG